MDMMMISSASSCTEASADHHNKHQHQGQQQEPMMGTAAVASAQREEVRSAKQARQQQQVAAGGSGERKPRPAQDHSLNCPRCDSTNTKFCYYNNYSMTQPRYFCKACRRYWTQGGSLRNVPVGGGCRKNKRSSGATAVGGSLPASSSSNSTPLVSGQSIMADFPNVLPTFMSNGFELPRKLPFAPLSLSSNPPPVMAPGAGSSFLDILRGGFLDGSINHQSNGFYGNGMAMPPSFGFGGVMQQHGMGEQTAAIGGGATAAATQGQGQGQVGDDGAHQQMGSSNGVGMESRSSTSYWNNSAASIGSGVPDTQASPPPANSFFINNSSFI